MKIEGGSVVRFDEWLLAQVKLRDGDLGKFLPTRDQRVLDFYRSFDEHILHEDRHLLIINKPPRVSSHFGSIDPIGVEEAARKHVGPQVSLAHRLDKDTTGVLLAAKTDEALAGLRMQFANKRSGMVKKYIAIVDGAWELEDGKEVSLHLAIDGDKTKVSTSDDPFARESITIFSPIAVLREEDGAYRSLLEVQIITGLMHQIRVVALHLGHPITGERLYKTPDLAAPRQMLHAWKMTFQHPITKEAMTVEAPVPQDMRYVLARMQWEW